MNLTQSFIINNAKQIFDKLDNLSVEEKIETINDLKILLHQHSPLKNEPVDCVLWIKADMIEANNYNPNNVAPPEMNLLEISVDSDGYTQPIVAWKNESHYEVVDGFHRNRVGKESKKIRKRIHGYLPISIINEHRQGRSDRIAATIRHNRARGKHQVESMSDIVVELKRRNWSNERVGIELGMDPDEVLRLSQISGLRELFTQREFSEAWEHTGPAEVERLQEEDEAFDLEWMPFGKTNQPSGWHDRTEKSSILYDTQGKHLGAIQRSQFKEEWFWYAYCRPMKNGRAETQESAKQAVEAILAIVQEGVPCHG